MSIEKVNTQLVGLPPAWMSRVVSRGGAMGNAQEIKKILGEPIPQGVDPDTLPPEIAAFFAAGGLLERLRKKLSIFSRKKGGKIIPARNTIASVDDEDNLYVGVDFLAAHGEDEPLIAGILAHEWGHMMSDLPRGVDWSHLTWDELHAIRRDEEGDADGFAGRAMFLMGYSPEKMIEFLKEMDRRRKDKKIPCHKYHNHATRAAILRESYEAEKRAMEVARRLFFAGSDPTG
ncbi:MAG: hypothetical protein V2A66_03150, partial [Pseudomonadota bacterium]